MTHHGCIFYLFCLYRGFFAVSVPFRELFSVMEVTEMRPASALPPALGLMLGIPGILGCAIGNLAADIVSGYSPIIYMLGFFAQFLYNDTSVGLFTHHG